MKKIELNVINYQYVSLPFIFELTNLAKINLPGSIFGRCTSHTIPPASHILGYDLA